MKFTKCRVRDILDYFKVGQTIVVKFNNKFHSYLIVRGGVILLPKYDALPEEAYYMRTSDANFEGNLEILLDTKQNVKKMKLECL